MPPFLFPRRDKIPALLLLDGVLGYLDSDHMTIRRISTQSLMLVV